uniref:AB hydrolase-1 domain-containing protein n=1 Tax=Quercus lobata TaxID=97700 RepID=A0A7N2LF93_QUELO
MFAVVLLMRLPAIGWAYRAIRPPPPKICGSPGGPPITAPRIKLRDGRNLAYKEHGVPAQVAKYKIIFVHGLSACRHSPVLYCVHSAKKKLAGVALLAPIINYWWHGLPPKLSTEAYYKQLPLDQWTVRVVHYIPWLTYLWNTQKWFPALSAVPGNPDIFSPHDLEIMSEKIGTQINKAHVFQQEEFESVHRTLLVGFGNWEFSPIDLENPFPNNEVSVHLWQGDEDKLVDVELQRFIAKKLPWIQYHELPGAGHFFPYAVGMTQVIIKTILFGTKQQNFDAELTEC